MQTIYAMHQNGSDQVEKEQRFLINSIDIIQDLYLMMLSILIELGNKETEYLERASQKHLATPAERNPNRKFVNNAVIQLLSNSEVLQDAVDKRKMNHWKLNDDYILVLLEATKTSPLYQAYMDHPKSSFADDRDFIVALFTEVIAPNEKLYAHLEDLKLTWIDDIPVVNTYIVKQLTGLSSPEQKLKLPKKYRDPEDQEYAEKLFIKTVLNEVELAACFSDKTPNWDVDRIAEVDTIILKMAICELLHFSSIPVKVTLNEYLEIAKEYSTPKSSIFINGILDNLVKDFQASGRLQKIGRGLI
ncbi:MAG: transcription antitermination factor NusB [Flavobacterium sp.]|nr:transcription antitermination factor NusB [Flavobacterium sp.]